MLSMSALTTLTLPAIASGRLPLGEERDHRLDREVPGASSELLEDRVQLLRVGAADVVDEPAHDVEERRRLELDALRALRGRFLQPLHHLFELGRVLDDVDHRPHRRIVDGQRRPGHRGFDDRVDRGGEPLLFAQDLGVVDFDDFETRAAGRGPEPGDAAIGADFFRAAREQEEQRAPRIDVGAGVERQAPDQVPVKERGELRDRRIGLGHLRAVDQQAVGEHLDFVGAGVGQPGARLFEP